MNAMGALSISWRLTGVLFASACLRSFVSAGPSIDVALRASFSSAPYLLELLETAADENATSYFPILDRIADGHFSKASSDKELYDQFIQVLKNDGHMSDPETLSSYQFALSMRSAAPRIEAHYQYYHTAAEPSLVSERDLCSVWVLLHGKQFCSPLLDKPHGDIRDATQTQELQFDRILGNLTQPISILYADITSPEFGQFHKALAKKAREGHISYRIRHKRPVSLKSKPLIIPGYGVELALKRTDYIVIDDRDDDKGSLVKPTSETALKFEDEELADLKPLSTSALLSLSLEASSFIMESESPFESLVRLSQDFPKYSSAVSSHNISEEFTREHEYNRATLVPAGFNVWWINGLQMIERQVEALSLLDILRGERKIISQFRDLGLTNPEAIQLLSHDEISSVNGENEPMRFDWRDDIEGGNVIIWLNDIEKDKRYAAWPTALFGMMRAYPGQLPSVRRDCFNLVVPVDFSSGEDIHFVAETLAGFVQRKLALRIGIVPLTKTSKSAEQAMIAYHLRQSYGLSALMMYLEKYAASSSTTKEIFGDVVARQKLRRDKVALSFEDVLKSEGSQEIVLASKNWVTRLSAGGMTPTLFIDGVALPRDETWLQSMSARVSIDLQNIQAGIHKEIFTQETWLPSYFLFQAATRRNVLVVPGDEKAIKIFNVNKLVEETQLLLTLPRVGADPTAPKADWTHMVLVADLSSEAGGKFLAAAIQFREMNPSIELVILHNQSPSDVDSRVSSHLYSHVQQSSDQPFLTVDNLKSVLKLEGYGDENIKKDARHYWQTADPLIKAIGFRAGENGILLNGRLLGPIPDGSEFGQDDFEQLLSYERSRRISPVYTAMEALGLFDKVIDPLHAAKLTSMMANLTTSDAPDGIFEQPSSARTSQFQGWNSSHTCIEVGDISTASIQMTVTVDPASVQGQKWIPILKVLSELDGVHMKLFVNPKERLQEIPVKRFYRYVLESKPTFDESGELLPPGASFTGVPQDALLTVGMDTPPAWLVAPKVSVHDLDNLKLSSIKTDVKALYEVEHILIEGHSRQIPGSHPPRGARLVMGTERDPHFADTIIMSNLGYFQFKANPGFYRIDLQQGRSSEIFQIESVGAKGPQPMPGDETTEVVLMSFQGTTLYPRLSRKPGMEREDVLEVKVDSNMNFVSRGLNFAQSIFSGKGQNTAEIEEQAEINIFSVASGHLYERMLNIMMVSVMKHTKHTVKFWFIEQFLSPSFRDFIPYLATEYGFKYEMVTYKWPHWLHAQSEKQRQIWGYKILFLDVLFPLSLEKVIFVDADQIVRTDMIDLVNHDLNGAPYGFTPMCDSRVEMEGFRFWKQGYWEKFLAGLPYHISALYVVDLRRFRQIGAGDRLRQQYHQLSADPNSLANLDQDLPNHMQSVLPIHSLPQEWLWCETWCSDESLTTARTIDLCNNPLTKEPKLDRARRQIPEWTVYDDEIAALHKRIGHGNAEKENSKGRIRNEL